MSLNDTEIERLHERMKQHPGLPNLRAGAEVLARLCRWTNANSDGWPYWKLPRNASRRLMALLASVDWLRPSDCADKELRAAFQPIKAFLRRQGADLTEVFPGEEV